MSMTDVESLVRLYLDRVWSGGDLAAFDELTTADFTYHLGGQQPRDRLAMRQFLESLRVAFPDWRVEVLDCIADGDRVGVRWQGRATHEGPFHGLRPTDKQVAVSGINLYRVVADKIATEWEQMDTIGLLTQLGVPLG